MLNHEGHEETRRKQPILTLITQITLMKKSLGFRV